MYSVFAAEHNGLIILIGTLEYQRSALAHFGQRDVFSMVAELVDTSGVGLRCGLGHGIPSA